MRLIRVLCTLTAFGLASPLYAQTFTWNGSGVWNNAANWNPNSAFPNSPLHEARFTDTAAGLISLSGAVTVNRLTFDAITGANFYTIGTGAVPAITLGGTNPQVTTNATVTSTGEQSINSDLLGTGNVVLNGGNLTLAGLSSTFTGSLSVNTGARLRITPGASADRPLGNVANVVTVNSGGQMFVNATGAGFIEVPYALRLSGDGPAGLPANQTGALRFGPVANVAWAGAITLDSNASIRWQGPSSVSGGITLGANTLTFLSEPAEGGLISTNGISGPGNVIFRGNTSITVNSTYSGSTTIDGALVTLLGVPNGLGQSLGTVANKATVLTGGELRLGGATFTVGNKLLTLSGGALVATSTNKTWGGAIDLTANSEIRAEATANLTLTGGISTPSSVITLNAQENGGRINVNTNGISGNGSVVTAGDGDINLNATSSYSGTTTIPAAFVYANGVTATGTGANTVSGTGVLRGTGSIGGSVTVNGTGSLAPGAPTTAGLLTVNNAVTLAAGSDFESRLFSAAAGDFDRLAITAGSLSFNGADLFLDTTAFAGGVPAETTFPLITASNGATITTGHIFAGLPEGTIAANANGTNLFIHYIYGSNGQIFLSTAAAIPEPTTWALLIGAAALAGYGISRRRQVVEQVLATEPLSEDGI
jgi:hypothetical protein